MALAFLGLALAIVIVLFVILQRAGGVRFPWIQFYIRGKEAGFAISEVNLLRKVAVANKLANPTSLFWSVKTLDRCIRSAIISFRSAGTQDAEDTVSFLIKLLDFRGRVEFDQPKYRLGLTSTRGISPAQTLKVTVEGGGAYVAKVIENNRKYLAITYPRGPQPPAGFSWKQQQLRVFFWRQEDAGYYFESKVLNDFLDRKVPILHVTHADNVVRAQKRRSIRRNADVPAQLFPLQSMRAANEKVATGGYRCKLLDVSEDGAAIAIGGRAKAGVPVKLQAHVDGEALILAGTIKSVNFKEKNQVSILHLEAEQPSDAMRIRILTYVYGLFTESATPSRSGTASAETTTEPKRPESPEPATAPAESPAPAVAADEGSPAAAERPGGTDS